MTSTPDADADAEPTTGPSAGQQALDAAQTSETGPDQQPHTGTRSAYLPVLPDGWTYEVALRGPGGVRVDITPHWHDDGRMTHRVIYSPAGEAPRRIEVDTLREAAKTAASGAKVLDRVYKGEEEVRRARQEALSVLGQIGDEHGLPTTAPSDRSDVSARR